MTSVIARPPYILISRQISDSVTVVRSIEIHSKTLLTCPPCFGGDQDHPVDGFRSIQRCCRCALQNVDAGYVIGIDVVQTIPTYPLIPPVVRIAEVSASDRK